MSCSEVGFVCNRCSAQFTSGRDLDLHLRDVHSDIRPFLCHLCPAKFKVPQDLEHHVETCSGPKTNTSKAKAYNVTMTVTLPTNTSALKTYTSTSSTSTSNRLTAPPNAKVIKIDSQTMKALLKQGGKPVVSKSLLEKLIANGQEVRQSDKKILGNPSKARQGSKYEGDGKSPFPNSVMVPMSSRTSSVSKTTSFDTASSQLATLESSFKSMGSNSPLKPFSCATYTCTLKFITIDELHTHSREAHEDDGRFCCNLCDMKFPVVSDIEEHVKSFVCPVDASGKWKGFGSMPVLPSGTMDILNHKLDNDLSLPNVSNLPGLKFEQEATRSTPVQEPSRLEQMSDSDTDPDDLDPVVLAEQKNQNKIHVCNVCSKSYRTLYEFTKHYRKHAKTNLKPPTNESRPLLEYPCNTCTKSFSYFEELFNHRKVHTGETPFGCRYCDKAYVDVTGLKHHMFGTHRSFMNGLRLLTCRVHKKDVAARPRTCFGKFCDMKGLRQHMQISHQETTSHMCSCDLCTKVFASPDDMEEHIIRNSECKIGAKITEWLTETPNIQQAACILGIYSTTACEPIIPPNNVRSRVFTRIRNSQETRGRKRVLRVELERNPKCPRCKKRFEPVEYLGEHYSYECVSRPLHHFKAKSLNILPKPGNSRRCPECGLVFWSSTSYDQHVKLHDTGLESEEKAVKKCSLCSRSFTDIVAFFEHYKSHGAKSKLGHVDLIGTGEKAVTDEAINNDSDEPPSKKIAHSTQTQKKPNEESKKLKFTKKCSICSQLFTTIRAFVDHYRTHQVGEEKKGDFYNCGYCQSQFISRQVYLNHMKIHSGETPYSCKFCHEAFASEKNLSLHIPAAHLKTKYFRLVVPRTTTVVASWKLVTSIFEIKLIIGRVKNIRWTCKCLECDQIFRTYKTMTEHIISEKCPVTYKPILIATREGEKMSLFCKICSNMYEAETDLEHHMNTSHML